MLLVGLAAVADGLGSQLDKAVVELAMCPVEPSILVSSQRLSSS